MFGRGGEVVLVVEFSPIFRVGLGLSLWILKEMVSPQGWRLLGIPGGSVQACGGRNDLVFLLFVPLSLDSLIWALRNAVAKEKMDLQGQSLCSELSIHQVQGMFSQSPHPRCRVNSTYLNCLGFLSGCLFVCFNSQSENIPHFLPESVLSGASMGQSVLHPSDPKHILRGQQWINACGSLCSAWFGFSRSKMFRPYYTLVHFFLPQSTCHQLSYKWTHIFC